MIIKHLLAPKWYLKTLPYVWLAFVLWLCLSSTPTTITTSVIPFQDKIAHMVFYTIAVVLFRWTYNKYEHYLSINQLLLATALCCFGILIEIAQHFCTQNRWADIGDVVANVIGIFLGFQIKRKTQLL